MRSLRATTRVIKRTAIKCIYLLNDLLSFGSLFFAALLSRVLKVSRPWKPRHTIAFGTMPINNLQPAVLALRELGFEANFIVWETPSRERGVIHYDYDWSRIFGYKIRVDYLQRLFSGWVFCWALVKFDIFISPCQNRFLDSSPFLAFFEYQLIRLSGGKAITNTYGGDVQFPTKTRLPGKFNLATGWVESTYYGNLDEEKTKTFCAYTEKYSDFIVSPQDHSDYLKRVDSPAFLRCVDLEKLKAERVPSNPIPVIFHANNHPEIKGTAFLEKAIENLNIRGIRCRLELKHHSPQQAVYEGIRKADIVADQFLIGAFGRFAIEAMAIGRPVVCFLRPDLYAKNPSWAECPIVTTDPDHIEATLETLLNMSPAQRQVMGLQGRKFVEKYHSPEYVGLQISHVIKRLTERGERIQQLDRQIKESENA